MSLWGDDRNCVMETIEERRKREKTDPERMRERWRKKLDGRKREGTPKETEKKYEGGD